MRFGKCFVIAIAIFTIIMCGVIANPADAADQILTAKIQKVEQKIDKNGQPYVRMFISERKELSGVQYETSTAVMGFGDSLVGQLKTVKVGDTLKMIVAQNEYKGRTSYNIIAIVK